jgi:hypothetical protein
MKITRITIVVLLLVANTLVVKAQLSDEAIYQKVLGSVFTIKTDKSQGSGFIFRDGMTLVTNYHVISGAKTAVAIPSDNKNVSYEIAGVVAADVKLDVAILKIKGTFRRPIDAAVNEAHVPQKVYAIGSPLGYAATFTTGNVSGIRDNDIQHTAPISPGSSGGPLLNEYGNILGMNTKQVTAGQNLNFAVSLNTIQSVLKNEHELVTIAQINQLYGTAVAQQKQPDGDAFANISGAYLEFDDCKAVLLMGENAGIAYVRYYSGNSKKIEIIRETCRIDGSYKASAEWTKIDCNEAVFATTEKPSYYIPDTFWINKAAGKMLISDTRKDDKGNLQFRKVQASYLDKAQIEPTLKELLH